MLRVQQRFLCSKSNLLASTIIPCKHYGASSFAKRYLSSKIYLDKVLVANRGDIACRVIRTCKKLGIPTVALYSVADGPDALHARMADEAYLIGTGPSPGDSYLMQDEVLRISQASGASAIHPGYGFLSENAGFSNRVQEAGIKFGTSTLYLNFSALRCDSHHVHSLA